MGKSKKRKKAGGNPARPKTAPKGHSHAEEDAAWIQTEPTPDGTGYMVTLVVDEDRSISLERQTAMECAYTVLNVVACAEYDASVLLQMAKRVNKESATQLVVDLRKDRPEPDFHVMAPLSLEPGVTSAGKPFVIVKRDGEPVGQWDLPDARQHALTILEALTVADLDAAYLRCLKGVVGLEEGLAQTVVGDVMDFRP